MIDGEKNQARFSAYADFINTTQMNEDDECIGMGQLNDISLTERMFAVHFHFNRMQRFVTVTDSIFRLKHTGGGNFAMHAKFYLNPPKDYISGCFYNNSLSTLYEGLQPIYDGPMRFEKGLPTSFTKGYIGLYMNDMVKIPIWRSDMELGIVLMPPPNLSPLETIDVGTVNADYLPKRKFQIFFVLFL